MAQPAFGVLFFKITYVHFLNLIAILVCKIYTTFMINTEQIQELGQQIGQRLPAERVVLFGSYAQGEASEDSDIDLLVVAKTTLLPSQRYAAVRRLLADYPAAFDIVVKTPEEYERWRSVVNHIVYFADKYGKVLYDRSHS